MGGGVDIIVGGEGGVGVELGPNSGVNEGDLGANLVEVEVGVQQEVEVEGQGEDPEDSLVSSRSKRTRIAIVK